MPRRRWRLRLLRRLRTSGQRRLQDLLPDEPRLLLVGRNDLARDQIERAVVVQFLGAARRLARLTQNQLVGSGQPQELPRWILGLARRPLRVCGLGVSFGGGGAISRL